ncbi:MAG: type IX secretion system sortase PorU [Chitinophagales bacterium]
MIRQKIKVSFLLSFLLLTTCLATRAQSNRISKKITIEWKEDLPYLNEVRNNDNEQLTILSTEEGSKLVFQFPIGAFNGLKYNLTNLAWESNLAGNPDLYIENNGNIAIASKVKYGVIEIPLEQKDNFNTYRLSSFNLGITLFKTASVANNRSSSVDNSVLRSGDWYKFGIEKTGVYKLSYEFLKSLGLDVDNIPTNSYSVFGQNGGMLPKLAGTERVDDLQEIPISVLSSSTVLKPGDYLIFYGEGPHKWRFNDSQDKFIHEKHLYADYKTYFITPNQGSGKRVGNINSVAGTAEATYTNFNDYVFVEEDLVNLNQSGSDWLGDEFNNFNNIKSYTFELPNLIGSQPSILDARLVARASSSSSFEIGYNGNTITTLPINGVDLDNYLGTVASASTRSRSFNTSGSQIKLDVTYNQPNGQALGWLDYLALNVTRELNLTESNMAFRVIDSKDRALVNYQIKNVNSATKIWEVNDLFNIKNVNFDVSGSTASFKAVGNRINEYVAFNDVRLEPIAIGKINNQNLHGLPKADMIIVTRQALLQPANELAAFHQEKDGLISHVVTIDQVYNEFSSGTNDITAIRDFLKMFYDRSDDYPKYVLLFGDGTFNNKELGDYFVPTFQSNETLATLYTYVADDFFVFLDDTEGDDIDGTTNRLDMAIGRIPADNLSKANIAVQKIKRYYDQSSFGNWRKVGTYIADDEDFNLHLRDAEDNSNQFIADNPSMNIVKIYLDAYNQVAGSGGGTYPDVNNAINKQIFKGTLFLNYIGHGGTNGLAEEGVITLNDIASWNNPNKLTLIISATCEFTRYDNMGIYSAGERAFFKEDGGAIALVTTVRVVFASKNKRMNESFMNAMTEAARDKTMTLGDIIKQAKNNSATQDDGNRKFTLIGDPALRLAFPDFKVQTTKINEDDYVYVGNVLQTDTLKALTKVTIEGETRDVNGQVMTDFNGFVYPTVYDKIKTISTLANDENSSVANFDIQDNIIYSGKVQAINGRFTYTFVVPKDINYTIGEGKISYYAHNEFIDGCGNDTAMVGGGGQLDSNSIDNDPPRVEVFIDDETWISGDFTDENPDLLINLFDENGINTVGSGIGHDIEAVIDNDNQNSINLNDFYESDLNSYQSGKILYPLALIPPGTHDVKVKAWDVYNNSGEGFTEFVVADNAELALEHVLNYPNPFTTSTNFIFEHNRKGDVLDVRIQVFTVSGRLVKTLQETATSETRNVQIPWDGLDDYGDKIGKGVYIYKVSLKDSSGDKVEQYQKLVLLR